MNNVIPAASGYPQYSGSLIPPMFSQDLIEQFYCTSIYGEITTTDYTGDLSKCGDTVTFFRSPKVTIRKGSKDGTIKHDTINTSPVTMSIDKELEFSVKIAQVDKQQICMWSKWQDSLLRSAAYEMAQVIDTELLCQNALEASPCNKGATAGVRTKSYNLGAVGAPLSLTSLNIHTALLAVRAVLKEQCIPVEDLFIILPDVAENVLLNSPDLRSNAAFQTSCQTACDVVLNGKLPAKIAGFDVYTSHNVCKVFDPAVSADAYQIIAGWRGATAFAATIEQTRIIDNDKDSWDSFIQGMTTYGHKVIQNEGLAMMYARFN